MCTFAGNGDARARVFYTTRDGAKHALRMVPDVRVLANGASAPRAADVLAYWRAIVDESPRDDPLRPVYDSLRFVHPDSALARYLVGAPIEVRGLESAPIYPFRCNLSQRQAVEYALTHSFSVIEGPPGTGKTETILNLIANIIATGAQTVCVVSFGNSAVDNVKEKLDELQFGHVVARLGNKDRVQAFFAGYETRTEPVQQNPPVQPSLELKIGLTTRSEIGLGNGASPTDISIKVDDFLFVRHEVTNDLRKRTITYTAGLGVDVEFGVHNPLLEKLGKNPVKSWKPVNWDWFSRSWSYDDRGSWASPPPAPTPTPRAPVGIAGSWYLRTDNFSGQSRHTPGDPGTPTMTVSPTLDITLDGKKRTYSGKHQLERTHDPDTYRFRTGPKNAPYQTVFPVTYEPSSDTITVELPGGGTGTYARKPR